MSLPLVLCILGVSTVLRRVHRGWQTLAPATMPGTWMLACSTGPGMPPRTPLEEADAMRSSLSLSQGDRDAYAAIYTVLDGVRCVATRG